MKVPTKYPDKILTEHLEFRQEFQDKYQVYNKLEERLGCLKYERVGRHIHWCWYQYEEIRMTPGCLQNVRDIQKMLINIRNKCKED